MIKKVAVVSLHFAPAHASHMMAYGKLLRELGYAVSFVLHEKYLSFAGFSEAGETVARAIQPWPRAISM